MQSAYSVSQVVRLRLPPSGCDRGLEYKLVPEAHITFEGESRS